jgi:hypothetical protein
MLGAVDLAVMGISISSAVAATVIYLLARRSERRVSQARSAELQDQIEAARQMQMEVIEQRRQAAADYAQAQEDYEQAVEEYRQGTPQRLHDVADAQANLRDAYEQFREWQRARLLQFSDQDIPALEEMARSDPEELERMLNMVRTIIERKEVSPEHPIAIVESEDEEAPARDVATLRTRKPGLRVSARFG